MNSRHSAKSPNLRFCTADFYYVFFKHKRKIIACGVAGVLAAIATWLLWPTVYQAEAKLLVRYINESKAPGPISGESKIKSPDERGETILNSEAEILTSRDLAARIVTAIGPEKILKGDKDREEAAAMIQKNLKVEVPVKSSVIRVTFRHPDPKVVQPVLNQLVESYLKSHAEIHRAVGLYDEFLSLETGQLRSRLNQTEEELRTVKNQAGVFSVQGSAQSYSEQATKIRQEIFNAEAELAERNAMLAQIGTSATKKDPSQPNEVMPEELAAQYQSVRRLLEGLYQREQGMLVKLAPGNPDLKKIRAEIILAQQLKEQLEEKDPRIAQMPITAIPEIANAATFDPSLESARVRALETRVTTLRKQLDKVRSEASAVGEVEPLITELERKKVLQESHYRYFSENLEQARIDEALRAGRFSNISVVQNASPPEKYIGKLYKVLLGLLLAGVLVGLGTAWIIEAYVDQSVKRPIDVEQRLGLPLFFSIPARNLNGRSLSIPPSQALVTDKHGGSPSKSNNGTRMEIVPWAVNHPLRGSLELLRDRLIFYFEIKKVARKPKLVAITSCREGAGVSTVAAGLAATLSETGEGNVLLVDMNLEHNLPQLFRKGDRSFGLDAVLNGDTREHAMVQDNLYVASNGAGVDKVARILPKSFTKLVPRIKDSDYDYIIFDMPPIGQNSVTPQFARFMDMVLMIVESERNSPDVIKRASAVIKESKSKLGIILNKTREYVPRSLLQEN